MKRMLFAAISMFVMLALFGCGGSSNPPPLLTAQVVSTAAFDGDIEQDSAGGFTITQGNFLSVFAGIDPVSDSEFRSFLNFPLTGAVPLNALIQSARLEIFISSILIQPAANSVPMRIELVSFPPQTLLPADFDRAALTASVKFPIIRSDANNFVSVDVTPLMVEAQRQGLANFQLRVMEDFGPVIPGLIEIDETVLEKRPFLEVFYF